MASLEYTCMRTDCLRHDYFNVECGFFERQHTQTKHVFDMCYSKFIWNNFDIKDEITKAGLTYKYLFV